MNEGLEPLRQKRHRWVEANRENHFEDGIKHLLTELYPDNAHFIYELLQNAEDTGATTVHFTLAPDELQFDHNGTRLFSYEDVESITNIGNSTKRNDPTSVGKFGVGFKAVFAYTTTPEIHSGAYQFRIRDLVVPDTSGVTQTALDQHSTRFVFPFNHPTKRPSQAVAEVGAALRALDAGSLLFLRHIRTIEYMLPDEALGIVERNDREAHVVEVHHRAPDGTETSTSWLRFAKDVAISLENGASRSCRVAIAYALGEPTGGGKSGAKRAIVPADPGRVCIYFPAEKETSNLRFHLHAPFASTVARDTVRDCAENKQLRDALADLIVESLATIRDEGLLTVDFLGVLPNPDDQLNTFYAPIRERLVQAFREGPLLPTRSGGHAAASTLYQGPAKIADVIGDSDLAKLTGGTPPLWAANAPQQNQRPSRFLDSLSLTLWSWGKLVAAVNGVDSAKQEAIERFVQQKADDRWVQRFYALLGEASSEHDALLTGVQRLRIIRVDGGEHELPRNAYFSASTDLHASPGVHFVSRSVYENKRSKQQTYFAQAFLENAGVRPFDEAAATRQLLSKYERAPDITDQQHCSDMRRFIGACKRSILSPQDFSGYYFIASATTADGKRYWCKPRKLALDSPYELTGLSEFIGVHGRYSVSPIYAEELARGLRDDFVKFLSAVGVMRALVVEETTISHNAEEEQLRSDWYRQRVRRTDSEINKDFVIHDMEKYAELKSQVASRLLWNALIAADRDCAKARYRPNQQYPIREAESQLVHYLKSVAWLPDRSGSFRKPRNATRADLPDGFDYDDRNGLLTAIEFGRRAREQDAVYRAHDESARSLGFRSAEDAEEARAVAEMVRQSGVSPDRLRALIQPQKVVPLPEAKVPQPARRGAKVMEGAANAPDRESVLRERSVDQNAPSVVLESRAYLRAKYTNDDGQTVCQCCRAEMPFKVRGEYYFEAVQCVRDLGKHYYQNRLALCPTCAAKYQHARETPDGEVATQVRNAVLRDGAGSVELQVRLAGEEQHLYFVGSHWFDLKTLLESVD